MPRVVANLQMMLADSSTVVNLKFEIIKYYYIYLYNMIMNFLTLYFPFCYRYEKESFKP